MKGVGGGGGLDVWGGDESGSDCSWLFGGFLIVVLW